MEKHSRSYQKSSLNYEMDDGMIDLWIPISIIEKR